MRLSGREQRTIIIEIGMQNAAQAISIASSPFVFANDVMAIPAIVYALMMNVILLSYVGILKTVKDRSWCNFLYEIEKVSSFRTQLTAQGAPFVNFL